MEEKQGERIKEAAWANNFSAAKSCGLGWMGVNLHYSTPQIGRLYFKFV